jgi:hypothetical protein
VCGGASVCVGWFFVVIRAHVRQGLKAMIGEVAVDALWSTGVEFARHNVETGASSTTSFSPCWIRVTPQFFIHLAQFFIYLAQFFTFV